MASHLVTPTVEQCYIIKFVVKGKVISVQNFHGLNAQYEEETLSHASAYDWYRHFPEGRKESSKPMACWQDCGKCVLGFRRSDSR
jgi:hypothetical protein